jgi:Homeodomain-like domain
MMAKKYVVELGEEARAHLRTLSGGGAAAARTLTHARILLKADQGEGGPGWTDAAIAGALAVGVATVARVRRAYVEAGLGAALTQKRPDREYERTFDGAREARLSALACSAPPPGREHWSLRLLAEHLVRLEVVAAVSHETVRRALQQTSSSRT